MTYDEIVRGLQDATSELQNEGRLVRAGLKTEQDTASILGRYGWLYSEESLDIAGEPADEAGRRVRAALLQGIIERRTAAEEDRLSTFYATTSAPVGQDQVPFFTALALMVTEPDPRRRETLSDGTGVVMAEADDQSLELNARVLDVVGELGFDGYLPFWSTLKGVDYAALRAELTRVADAARGRYRAWVEPRMERCRWAFGDCPEAHLAFLRALHEHDAAFSAAAFAPAMRRTFDRLGLALFATPAIHLDLADRPAKNPRASVWVPEAGREVHLLTRPAGGSTDYSAFLHEAGHALHFGLTDPSIGWPLANLGRSMAYAELWSFLFERIGHDPEWIAEATRVSDAEAEQIATDLTGVDLMLFMRYVGKLTVELDLYAGDALDRAWGQSLYVELPTARTGFRYDPRAWQFDRDPGFYSADYLRAWLAEAALDRWLRRSFGARWWASRDAGDWLREQWRRGWAPEAEDLVAEIGGMPWSGAPLLERLEQRLPVPA